MRQTVGAAMGIHGKNYVLHLSIAAPQPLQRCRRGLLLDRPIGVAGVAGKYEPI